MHFFFYDCWESSDNSNPDSCGVGMEILKDSKGCWRIVGIRPGGPADMARLTIGDEVISVDFDSINVRETLLLFFTEIQFLFMPPAATEIVNN